MRDDDMKWLAIGTIGVIAAVCIGGAISDWAGNNARKDIVVACYQSGHQDCDKLWKKDQ